MKAGEVICRSAVTTLITVDSGTLKIEGEGALEALTTNGGISTMNGKGTITALIINNGTVDFLNSEVGVTITALKLNPGGILKHDPARTAITAWTEPDYPITLRATAG